MNQNADLIMNTNLWPILLDHFTLSAQPFLAQVFQCIDCDEQGRQGSLIINQDMGLLFIPCYFQSCVTHESNQNLTI